jgi:WD40 repeat protein
LVLANCERILLKIYFYCCKAKEIQKKASLSKKKAQSSELIRTISSEFRCTRLLVLTEETLLVSGARPEISIWNIKIMRKLGQLIGHDSSVKALAKLDSDEIVASGSLDASIKIWNCSNGRLTKNLTHEYDTIGVVDLAFFKKHKLFSCSIHYITIWNTTDGSVLKTVLSHVALCLCLFDNKQLVTKVWHFEIRIWFNVDHLDDLQPITWKERIEITFVNFLSTGNLAYSTFEGLIRIRNVTTGFLVNSLCGHRKRVTFFIELKTGFLASASADARIKIWNYTSGDLLKTLTGHFQRVDVLCFFKHQDILMSSSVDKTLNQWNLINVFKNFTDKNQTIDLEYGNYIEII